MAKKDASGKAAVPANSAAALSRQLRITALTMVFTLGVIFAVTMAWFASNRNVDSSGMEMQINSETPDLKIKKHIEGVSAYNTATAFSVDSAPVLAPAQHFPVGDAPATNAEWDAGWRAVNATEYASAPAYTGLRWNTNPTAVDDATGLQATGAPTMKFKPVPVYSDGNRRYYIDYEVDLACSTAAMTIDTLTATLSLPEGVTLTAMPDHDDYTEDEAGYTAALNAYLAQEHKYAASVDFFVGSVTEANYKGTLNLAGKNYATSADLDPNSVTLQTGGTVPLIGATDLADAPIHVIMRFYFVGDLLRSTGQAYVHTDQIVPANLTTVVTFTVTEP